MRSIIDRLPKRFQWTIHNMVAHPLMEVFYQIGLLDLSEWIHQSTTPSEEFQTLKEEG